MLEFRLPEENDRSALEQYVQEHRDAGETGDLTATSGLENMPFEDWLRKVHGNVVRTDPWRKYCLLCLDGGRLIGFVHIRPWLKEEDVEVYGHIGYAVRPSERRKGYGTQMMRYGLWFCREKGLRRVVAGCYKENAASAGVLRKSGGVLYKEGDYFKPGVISQYYEYYL